MIKLEQYNIGKSYTIYQIDELKEELKLTPNYYGDECIGKEAIHLIEEDSNTDVWFILDSTMGGTYYYKLVYKN